MLNRFRTRRALGKIGSDHLVKITSSLCKKGGEKRIFCIVWTYLRSDLITSLTKNNLDCINNRLRISVINFSLDLFLFRK